MEQIQITGVSSQMQGVGRGESGKVVFVEGALPGEIVRVTPVEAKGKNFDMARLAEVVQPASGRVTPDCPYYGVCGGCQLRHADYETALEMKRTRVQDALSRIGGAEQPRVLPALGCERTRRYRNKAEYAIVNGETGMFAAGGKRLVPVEDCLLQKKESIALLRALAPQIRRAGVKSGYLVTRVNEAGESMVILSTAGTAPRWLGEAAREAGAVSVYHCALKPRPTHALDGVCRRVWGAESLTETLCGLKFRISPQTFFQVNTPQAQRLYEIAIEAAGVGENAALLDAYCGCGTIALSAANRAGRVLGVEIVPPAIADAKINAKVNGLSQKAEFVCADAGEEIPARVARGEKFQCVIVDPPRKGCDPRLIDALAAARLERVAYVSCDPGTLARDVARLAQKDYRLQWAQPVDMFPGTAHVETVCLLALRNPVTHINIDVDVDEMVQD